MSLIERARERAKNPKPHRQIVERQEGSNDLTRQFCSAEINLNTFREKLFKLQKIDDEIVLNNPGPLYGLLRELGLDKESAQEIAEEERAHFRVAQREGLNPRIVLEFSEEIDEEGTLKQYLNALVVYQIPKEIEGKKMRKILKEIALAPEEPSEDDLASLPKEEAIFP